MAVLTLQERIAELMSTMRWSHGDLMRVSGQSSAVVSQWRGVGNGKQTKSIAKLEAVQAIEAASGFSALWVAKGMGPKMVSNWTPAQSPSGGMAIHTVAHYLSHPTVDDELTTHPWEFVLSAGLPLPKRFCTAVPDDALAPRSPRGTEFVFSSTFTGTPEDSVAVIVQTAGGRRYMRLYFALDGDAWEARARDPAVPVLHSDRDGLQLLAVAVFRPGGQA